MNTVSRTTCSAALAASFLLLATACGDRPAAAGGADQAPVATPAPAAAPVEAPAAPERVVSMEDVIEHDPRYVVGISFPPSAASQPGLASALYDYAQSARAELQQAVAGLEQPPTAPYELSLGFRSLLESPDVVAVAADGSLYTGGAHGQPLVARFVWLPQRDEMLTSSRLLASAADWGPVAEYIGEQLAAAAHTRAADESLDPADRRRLLGGVLKMIGEGTRADPANFAQFEPIQGAGGKLGGLRFVFAPYQVGPYADGVQYVDVPAAVLRPHLAQDYRDLFAP